MEYLFPSDNSDEKLEEMVISGYARKFTKNKAALQEVMKEKTFELQIAKSIELGTKGISMKSDNNQKFVVSLVERLRMSRNADLVLFAKLNKTTITLAKAKTEFLQDIPTDYGLQQFSSNAIIIQVFDGDHASIAQNFKLGGLINSEAESLEQSTEVETMVIDSSREIQRMI